MFCPVVTKPALPLVTFMLDRSLSCAQWARSLCAYGCSTMTCLPTLAFYVLSKLTSSTGSIYTGSIGVYISEGQARLSFKVSIHSKYIGLPNN